MKQIITFFLLLGTSWVFGQSLQRDNLIGLHVMEVKLNEGVTMEEFQEFFVNHVIPEYEKHFMIKGHLVKSVRGEYKDKLGLIWVFATEPTRDYYFNEDGTPNEYELEGLAKAKPVEDELKRRFGSYVVDYKDDWVVQ